MGRLIACLLKHFLGRRQLLTRSPPVMAIPVCLLWRIQIKTSRKLALASSLCLSIIMIMIAVTRIAGIRSSMGTVDIV